MCPSQGPAVLEWRREAPVAMHIETQDGLIVCVPGNPQNLSMHVFLEQEDWLDPEMDLVRQYVQPGMNCLDVGASFGAYALLAAKLAGEHGKTYAFEPEPEQACCLEQSKSENCLANLEIIPMGCSDRSEPGTLHIPHSPECSSMIPMPGCKSRDIPLIRLDDWWDHAGRPEIDLVKIDVNGHEPMVLQGAVNLLTQTSPLVIIAAASPDPRLAKNHAKTSVLCQKILTSLGYGLHAYLPGPGLLCPPDPSQGADACLLNLVASRKNLAGRLVQSGLLPHRDSDHEAVPQVDWHKHFSTLGFAMPFMALWKSASVSNTYHHGLNMLCAAQDRDAYAPTQRLSMLHQAARSFSALQRTGGFSGSLCFVLARTFHELGWRDQAAETLMRLERKMRAGKPVDFDLPFLPPLPVFDHARVAASLQNWIIARCCESLVWLRRHSSHFMDQENLRLLQSLQDNPEISARTRRTLDLLALKHGFQPSKVHESGPGQGRNHERFWHNISRCTSLHAALQQAYPDKPEEADNGSQPFSSLDIPGLWEAGCNPVQDLYYFRGIVRNDVTRVYLYCDSVFMKEIHIRQDRTHFKTFAFPMLKDVLEKISSLACITIVSDQGVLLNANGATFQTIHGKSETTRLPDYFSQGWYVSKKGNLVFPLAKDDRKRAEVFSIYRRLNRYFEQTFGYNLWVAHGSLLGLCRDGALLPFDDDFDVSYTSRMRTPREVVLERICIASRMKLDGWNLYISETGLIKPVPKGTARSPLNKYLDIMPGWWQNGHFFCMAWTMLPIKPQDMFPLREVEYYNAKFLFPNNPELFLECKYGKDWRTPDQGYTPKKPEGSEKILAQALPSRAEHTLFISY